MGTKSTNGGPSYDQHSTMTSIRETDRERGRKTEKERKQTEREILIEEDI